MKEELQPPQWYGESANAWLCPNLPAITLNNNIEQGSLRVGQNLNFVLNYCFKAGLTEGI